MFSISFRCSKGFGWFAEEPIGRRVCDCAERNRKSNGFVHPLNTYLKIKLKKYLKGSFSEARFDGRIA